jgi:hypothetical protein
MTTSSTAATVNLANGQSLALPDIRGTAFMVTQGTVWITQENDTQDVVLRQGDMWMVSRDGLTIIEAQNDASMRALGPAFARALAARRGWWTRFVRWFNEKASASIDAGSRKALGHYY